jgi:hypothetical protein
MSHLFARPLCGEHPLDAGTSGIALILPSGDLRFETFPLGNAAVQALRTQHADFNFDHVQPTGVFGREVELQAAQDPACLVSRKGFVEGTRTVG